MLRIRIMIGRVVIGFTRTWAAFGEVLFSPLSFLIDCIHAALDEEERLKKEKEEGPLKL
jgi:hypothetical protein